MLARDGLLCMAASKQSPNGCHSSGSPLNAQVSGKQNAHLCNFMQWLMYIVITSNTHVICMTNLGFRVLLGLLTVGRSCWTMVN